MKLSEITKAAFHQKLANPVLNEVLDELVHFSSELHSFGWNVNYTESANGDYVSVECTNIEHSVSSEWIARWKIYDESAFLSDLTTDDVELDLVQQNDDSIIFNIIILRRG